MHNLSIKLFSTHVVAVAVWIENTQNVFGLLGAIAGFFSAVMLIVINWDAFMESKAVKLVRSFFKRS